MYTTFPKCSPLATISHFLSLWVSVLYVSSFVSFLFRFIWRPWCWERLKAGGEGDDRGWDGSMESPTEWTWVWVNSWSWRWTRRPGMLQSMGSQRVGHDWATKLNWTELLEKTPESPLNFKEIKPVDPKGSQPWIFLGRTDAEVEAAILWPPDSKS